MENGVKGPFRDAELSPDFRFCPRKEPPTIDPESHDQGAAGPGMKWDGMKLLDCTEELICVVSTKLLIFKGKNP